jgi:hypothetical protein
VMEKKNAGRKVAGTKVAHLAMAILLIAVNLAFIRDARHFRRNDFVMLFMLDFFFPVVAFSCGLVGRRVVNFTVMLLCIDLLYLMADLFLALTSC